LGERRVLHVDVDRWSVDKLTVDYTPLAVVSRARKTLRVSTTAGIAQIPAVESKEGAVFGAVLSTRKFHRGHH
jgi:hypothetical protein